MSADSAIETQLSLLDRIEFGAKAGTAAAALTYISGYLTVTTYLGRFGVHTDAGDFLRAKYVYIGFEYWFFFVVLAVLLIFLFRLLEWFRAWSSDTPSQPNFSRAEVINSETTLVEMERGPSIDSLQPAGSGELRQPDGLSLLRTVSTAEFRALRWSFIVMLLLSVLSIEVLLASPAEIYAYLPIELIFLLHVLLYQTVRYAWLSPYRSGSGDVLYVWGCLYGRSIAEFLSDYHAVAMMACAGILVLHKYAWVTALRNRHWHIYWLLVFSYFLGDMFAVWLLHLGYRTLSEVDRRNYWGSWGPWSCGRMLSLIGLSSTFTWRRWLRICISWLGVAVFVGAACEAFELNLDGKTSTHIFIYRFCLELCRWVMPFFILVVTANLWLLAAMRKARNMHIERILGQRGMPTVEDRSAVRAWQTWVLRIAPATALYVASIFGFSRVVYPLIPEGKAGGKLNDPAALVRITTIGDSKLGSCPTVSPSIDYVILDEDSSFIYLIRAKEVPRYEDHSVPSVLEISRSCVGLITTIGQPSHGSP